MEEKNLRKQQITEKKYFFKKHKKMFVFLSLIFGIIIAIGIAAIIDGTNGIKKFGNRPNFGYEMAKRFAGNSFFKDIRSRVYVCDMGRSNTVFCL